jgi:hypothetical protein
MSDRLRSDHLLRLHFYPEGDGPHDRWEITVALTGEVVIGGAMPIDYAAVRETCTAYHRRRAEANLLRMIREIVCSEEVGSAAKQQQQHNHQHDQPDSAEPRSAVAAAPDIPSAAPAAEQ